MPAPVELERFILDFYLASAREGSFNGVSALKAAAVCRPEGPARDAIKRLVELGTVDCVFARRDTNPHIKRLPVLPKERQLELINTESPLSYCLYPSPNLLALHVDPTEFSDRPFSRAMLLGEAQLSFVTFELAVLGRYRGDPRFIVKFHDYMGDMFISDEYYHSVDVVDRDKIAVSSFGLGLDDNLTPHIVVFYRYLHNLTPEHQQYWNSFRAKNVPMCEPYYQSAVIGEWWENRSARYAIQEEMRIINEISMAAFSVKLLRQEITDDLPFDLSAFLVPSSENFAIFIHSWDKLLSENLNKDFFRGKIELTFEEKRADGRLSVYDKGTVSLLREWLEATITGKDRQSILDAIIGPLQRIRKLRQKPAHGFQKNEFSEEFHATRRQTLTDILNALACLRTVLSRYPEGRKVHVPEWLNSSEIHIF